VVANVRDELQPIGRAACLTSVPRLHVSFSEDLNMIDLHWARRV
jgi:hypothetical protein